MTKPKAEQRKRSALVTVFKDIETAEHAIHSLLDAGFEPEQLELVTHHVFAEAPEVTTPTSHQTTMSTMLTGIEKWGAVGAGSGVVAGLLAPFPGAIIGMAVMGGLTGMMMGGIAGVDEAVIDDSVDLPRISDYEQLVKDGHKLVVVLCDHEQIMKAENVMEGIPFIHNHTHVVNGHEFHEHPTDKNTTNRKGRIR